MEAVKKILQENDNFLWAFAFVGVCVLVGVGKLKPETVELMVMAIIGRLSTSRKDGK